MTGYQAFLTPLGMIDFAQGVVYGSGLVQNTTHLETCVTIASRDYVKAAYRMMRPEPEDSRVFTWLNMILKMTWSLHPLLTNC